MPLINLRSTAGQGANKLTMAMRTCLLVLMLQVAATFADDADSRKHPEFSSDRGDYKLRVEDVWQGKSPWDEKAYALNIRFRLGFPGYSRPMNTFVDGEEPLVAAFITPGIDIASHRHFGGADNVGPLVEITHLEIGAKTAKIHRMEIAVTIVKVLEWEEVELKDVREGKNEILDCGPFGLACTGLKNSLLVSAAAFGGFEKQREAYQARMPLKFIGHRFALEHLSVKDSAAHALSSSMGIGTGGSSNTSFVIPENKNPGTAGGVKQDQRATYPIGIHGSFESGSEITYPVTITVKLPKRFEKERVRFRVDDLAVPEPK